MFTIPSNGKVSIYGPEMINVEAEPVFPDEWSLLKDLRTYMIWMMKKHNGIGLAAPQIGVNKQFFIMEMGDGRIVDVVNPLITQMYGFELPEFEACLSIPPFGNGCDVPRCDHVKIHHSTSKNFLCEEKVYSRMDSRVAQHEADHLNGTFFIDRVHPRWKAKVLKEFHKWKDGKNAEVKTGSRAAGSSPGVLPHLRNTPQANSRYGSERGSVCEIRMPKREGRVLVSG